LAIDYHTVFLQKTGMASVSNPISDTEIDSYLDQAAYLLSSRYATPWGTFTSVTEKYKYGVTLLAAIEYWWGKVAEYVSKFDTQFGQSGGLGQRSESMFTRALRMIESLKEEISQLDIVVEGSGDILVGDLVRRSKWTGNIVPNDSVATNNWLS
jgi:hypothetical protein